MLACVLLLYPYNNVLITIYKYCKDSTLVNRSNAQKTKERASQTFLTGFLFTKVFFSKKAIRQSEFSLQIQNSGKKPKWWQNVTRVNQSCPRVGWTRGSGRVGSSRVGSRFCQILVGRVGSGQHFGFLVFY